MDLEQKVAKLKRLKPYQNKTDEEIKQIIIEKESVDSLEVGVLFSDKEEKKLAIDLAKKYLQDYVIETISDKNTLKQLIYLETLHIRLGNSLNEFQDEKKIPPPQLIDALHKNVTQINQLKNQLELTKPKDSKMESGFKALMDLKKKFSKWREENQGSRTLICPHCGKMIMLKIRTNIWESQKHPFFQDRILSNKHLLKLYKENKITKEDVAKVLETSIDYIDWVLSKVKLDG